MLALPQEGIDHSVLVDAASRLGVPVVTVMGDPNDLVRRYSLVASWFGAHVVVRIPGDNVCVCPREIDRIIGFYFQHQPNWSWLVSNLDQNIGNNGYPGGLGAEVYSWKLLDYLNQNVTDPELREHPHKSMFITERVKTLKCPELFGPELKFSVDTIEDLQRTRDLYAALGTKFTGAEAVRFLKEQTNGLTDTDKIGKASIRTFRNTTGESE